MSWAIQDICSEEGEPWYKPQKVARFLREYNDAIGQANTERFTEQKGGDLRVVARWFGI